MIRIPGNSKRFSQPNRGDALGSLWSTWNADLQDVLGALRVGDRLKLAGKTGDSGLANLTTAPTAFTYFGSDVFCLSGSRVFASNKGSPDMAFAEDASTNAQTDYSADADDLCNFNGALVASNSAQGYLYSLNGPGLTWTQRSEMDFISVRVQLGYFRAFNRLYAMSSSNRVQSVDTSWNPSAQGSIYDLTLPAEDYGGSLQCMACGSDRIWLGMKMSLGAADDGQAANLCSVFEWDGISNQVTKEYKIPALGVMAIILDSDIPVIIDTEGIVRKYDGNGFKEVGRLPLRRGESLVTGNSLWTQNFIHPKGLVLTKDATLLALINNRTQFGFTGNTGTYEALPSGVWEFDMAGSASHRHPLSATPVSSASATDYGQNRVNRIGSLAYLKYPSVTSYGATQLFAGAEYYSDATTTVDGIFMQAPFPTGQENSYPEGVKYGYAVTPFLQSSQAQDSWLAAFVMHRRLSSGDSISVKYRTVRMPPVEFTLTWAATDSFTTATDLSAYVGWEVEVLQGDGSGKCAHISTVTGSGPFTVTLDDGFAGVGTSTAMARAVNFTKASAVGGTIAEIDRFKVGATSPRLQVKVCLEATGDAEMESLSIANGNQQPIA